MRIQLTQDVLIDLGFKCIEKKPGQYYWELKLSPEESILTCYNTEAEANGGVYWTIFGDSDLGRCQDVLQLQALYKGLKGETLPYHGY